MTPTARNRRDNKQQSQQQQKQTHNVNHRQTTPSKQKQKTTEALLACLLLALNDRVLCGTKVSHGLGQCGGNQLQHLTTMLGLSSARRPREKKMDKWVSLIWAILYELQPLRFSQYINSPSAGIIPVGKQIITFLGKVSSFFAGTFLPWTWSTLRNLTRQQSLVAASTVIYYLAIRWIHEKLDAGPLVLIITALVAIFTTGLRDKADGELSAYAVFNRNFQRLLGSVDVEELVNQHVGGGMMMGGMMQQALAEENQGNNNPRGRNERINDNNNARENQGVPVEANGADDSDDEELIDGDDNANDQQNQRARKSGKKARRRNREEKIELRRQREAAMALGLDGTGGQEEVMAMQRLIEDQVAAGNNNLG